MSEAFIIIKQDAVKRGLIVDILHKFQINNFSAIRAVFKKLSFEEASDLYSMHREKPFFNDLINFMTDGESYIVILKSDYDNPIELVRNIVMDIRSKFGTSIRENCIHASDSLEAVKREMSIFFNC